MAVLITGAGVVGSQIARVLVERGEKPILMDIAPQLEALGEIVDLGKVTLVRGNVLEPYSLTDTIGQHQITHIAHTVANPMLTLGAHQNPYAAIQLNIMGTVNVLEAARIHGLERVVVSSSNVVGQHIAGGGGQGNTVLEEAFPRPVTIYATTKQAVENIGLNYARWNNVDFAAVRYGAVAGPWSGRGGGGPTGAFLKVVTQALKGEEAVVPAMDFEWVYAKDAGAGTVLALFAAKLETRVFNITMGTLVTAAEFADALSEVIPGARVRIEDPQEGGMDLPDTHIASDIGLARKALGFEPEYGIVDSIRDLAEWLKRTGIVAEAAK